MTFEEALAALAADIAELSGRPGRPMPPQQQRQPDPLESFGMGPVTERSRAGLMPAEMRSREPSVGELVSGYMRDAIGNRTIADRVAPVAGAVMDYGPMPAQAYAQQVETAGDAIGNLVEDPSLKNATLAAGHSALAVPLPSMKVAGAGLGAFGLGMGEALVDDSEIFNTSANAAGLDVNIPLPDRVTPEDRMQAITGVDVAGNRQQELELERIRAQAAAEGQAAVERARQDGLAVRESAAEKAEKDKMQRETALSMRNAALAKARRFADTQVGQYYDAMGGYAPIALGATLGGVARAAVGPGGDAMKKYLLPYLVGTSGVLTGQNAPDIYDATQQASNPQKEAYQIYARELPIDDPERQRATDYAESLGDKNPVSDEAIKRLTDLGVIGPRIGMSFVEGLGGLAGADAVSAASRAAKKVSGLPGDIMEGAGALVPRFQKGWNSVDTRPKYPAGGSATPPSTPPPAGGAGALQPPQSPAPQGTTAAAAPQSAAAAPPGSQARKAGGQAPPQNQKGQGQGGPSQQSPVGTKAEQTATLEAIVNGSALTKRQQTIAAYLTKQAQDLGTTPDKMLSAFKSGSKLGRYAVPAAAGAGAASLAAPDEANASVAPWARQNRDANGNFAPGFKKEPRQSKKPPPRSISDLTSAAFERRGD